VSNQLEANDPDAAARSGRPRRTSRAEVASVALRLFVERGFEATTITEIADAVGVSRRTILRYFSSKNDIVWGTFDERLQALRERLAAAPVEQPIAEVIREAVVSFNDYGEAVMPELRDRMTLIITVPALQGHAMLRYAEWCSVISEFAAARLGVAADEHVPQLLSNTALGIAMATYRYWIEHPETDLLRRLDEGLRLLSDGFDENVLAAAHRGRRTPSP
jgi:TetR/AcrR family transcriptional regulator, regulator of mycofactocin system